MNFSVIPGAIANGDMSTMQFSVVVSSTANPFEVALSTSALLYPYGILQNDPNTSGHGAEVAHQGVCKARYGGTVNQGTPLASDSLGRLIESTGLGEYKIATALQSGSCSEIHYVLLNSPHREATAN